MSALRVLFVLSIATFVSTSALSAEEAKKQIWANAAICKKEHNIDGNLKEIFKSDQEQPENINCFLECVFKKNGFINNGAVDREKYQHALTVHINPDAAGKVADHCIKGADVSSCAGVGKLHICTVKKAKELSPGDVEAV